LFQIPGADGANTKAKASLSGVGLTGSGVGGSGAPVSEPGKSGIGRTPGQIVFLCPNGHRVNAPLSLQGRAGQCPICGAQFVIPTQAEIEKPPEELGLAEDTVASGSATRLPPPQQEHLQMAGAHPLCNLLRKLWNEKEHGGVIEIHLSSGALLVPDWFDERHSRLSHGLFAAQSADGTVTMTIVAWDNIARIVVRNVEGLPEGMFE
jgi:hypothetical protein